jgi:ubiquinone/menaquinone biosynthesis C-methylase UbiE
VVASKRKRTIGSEYLRDGTVRGTINAAGVRHEDVTHLSFPDGAFNVIGTFDVLEHVPNYRQALAEFFRCLRPSGALIITVPFSLWSAATVTRATIDASGNITHLLPPRSTAIQWIKVAHCVSIISAGIFVGALTEAGFEDAGLSMFWHPRLGYLGGYQYTLTARSPER